MKNLTITEEKITNIIEENRKSNEWDKMSSNETPVDQLRHHFKNPGALKFSELVNDLSLEEKKELSALFWLGRGDFANFKSAYENANRVVGDGKLTAHYLGGKDLSKYIPKSFINLSEEGISLKD